MWTVNKVDSLWSLLQTQLFHQQPVFIGYFLKLWCFTFFTVLDISQMGKSSSIHWPMRLKSIRIIISGKEEFKNHLTAPMSHCHWLHDIMFDSSIPYLCCLENMNSTWWSKTHCFFGTKRWAPSFISYIHLHIPNIVWWFFNPYEIWN